MATQSIILIVMHCGQMVDHQKLYSLDGSEAKAFYERVTRTFQGVSFMDGDWREYLFNGKRFVRI